MATKEYMQKRGWATRTVKDGKVKVWGKWFKPDEHHLKHDGRLEGIRFLFGVYWRVAKDRLGYEHYMLALWGTEEHAKSKDPEFPNGPEIVDGTVPWYFWEPVKEGDDGL